MLRFSNRGLVGPGVSDEFPGCQFSAHLGAKGPSNPYNPYSPINIEYSTLHHGPKKKNVET